ncbi:helix-turn-helix domain-containing protein [Virgibacillus sp. C22-A2]|uniref:Helix-turn-helix domain-containing protein n=1 Tax=Virgibacillus tibetensis TaxID=3042313 RepID=A0ABU6KGT3_9BACI|nr:helix-turn-helix domain-containing protein [Virgibacillus sp. C22-A2]
MNDKKMNLIEAGMKLFAVKGYHSTSIQEIATEAGISKGTFYLYFQSKEDFIATSFHYFHTEITERIEKVKQDNLSPKETLAKQITVLIHYIYKHKDFIVMHLRENISIGQNTDRLIHKMKVENFHWMKDSVKAIYGDSIDYLLFDTIIQVEGLMNGYFKWIVIDDIHIEKDMVGPFIIRRMDDIVRGMLKQDEAPLVTIINIPEEYEADTGKDIMTLVAEQIMALKKKVTDQVQDNKKTQLSQVVEAIEAELNKKELQPLIIQGLLAHFGRSPELMPECKRIAQLLNIELIH